MLTLGHNPETTLALWLDALTHASEWAGMMGLIHTVDQWVDWTQEERGRKWFQENTIYCVPCVSPDGLEALMRGEPIFCVLQREKQRKACIVLDLNLVTSMAMKRFVGCAGKTLLDRMFPMKMHRLVCESVVWMMHLKRHISFLMKGKF